MNRSTSTVTDKALPRAVRDISSTLGAVFLRSDAESRGLLDRPLLDRLVRAGYLRRVQRGVYEITEQPKVLIAHDFVLALALVSPAEDAYVSWRSAFSHWGLTEQLPKVVQIGVRHPLHPPRLPGGRLQLVIQGDDRRYGITVATISGSPARITTPEKAIIDCLDRPDLSGGMSEMVRALVHPSVNHDALVELAVRHPTDTLVRRLGYLLEVLQVGRTDKLRIRVLGSKRPVRLDLGDPPTSGYNRDWRVIDNIGPDEIREMAEA